ncbi:Eco57I restriction-modification methylase domain-containing protein [Pseudodesulfovibrio profundus]|uniref:Eco57I restriction-modification methylase domain-containing protein n=1 Tax=Pseudodesulfovibrio profundus TaxID=57320 RepID=UPI000BE3EEF5|nr:N-6 DNA methylase [Pseudodesulfovibrio profundus]
MHDRLRDALSRLENLVAKALTASDMESRRWAETLLPLVTQAKLIARQYGYVVTNPPYMGGKGLNPALKTFLKDNYADVKSDLFSAFVVRNFEMSEDNAQLGFMSPFVWMFISSYEKLRDYLIDEKTITSLIQLEYSGFDGATVPICTYTLANSHLQNLKGSFIRLSDFRGADNQAPKTLEAIRNKDCGWYYTAPASDFKKIPGSPIAYWASSNTIKAFENFDPVCKNYTVSPGIRTGKDEWFLRFWFEVSTDNIQFNLSSASQMDINNKWFPLHKGGDYRKWHGNCEHIIDLKNEGESIKDKSPDFRLRDKKFYFKQYVSWSRISSSDIAFRYYPKGVLFSDAGPGVFSEDESLWLMAALNSPIGNHFLRLINPTLNYQKKDIELVPYVQRPSDEACSKLEELFKLSKFDWDASETSWDFLGSPLINNEYKVENAYEKLTVEYKSTTQKIKSIEEEYNSFFITALGLQEELCASPHPLDH